MKEKNKKKIVEFTLAGCRWKVLYKEKGLNEINLGYCHNVNKEIVIATKFQKQKIRDDVQEETFYHELVHAILQTLGNDKLSANENFVQSFGTLLHQFIVTSKEI